MDPFKELLSSKKFLVALLGLLVAIGSHYAPGLKELDTEQMATLMAPLVAYIIGQGLADFGKNANVATDETKGR